MYIVFGHKLYGKTDAVPGFFHVATKFAHVYYIPLIPTGSFLVLAQDGKTFRGVPIELSAKSLFLTWARAGCVALMTLFGCAALVVALDKHPDTTSVVIQIVLSVIALALLITSYFIKPLTNASPARAFRLAQMAGINAPGLAQLRQHFGLSEEYCAVHGFPVAPAAAPAAAPRTRHNPADDLAPIPLE